MLQTQRCPEGPRHLHSIPHLSEAPWEVPSGLRQKSRETRVSCRHPRKTSRVLLQSVLRPLSPPWTREQRRAPPRLAHGDLASLVPHERLLRSSSCLVRKPPRAPQLEETPETPPSSRAEGLLFLHGLESNPGPLSKRKRRLDSLEAAQGAPRDPRRDSRGERSPWLPLETRPDSPGEPGMQPRDPCLPWRGKLGPGHTLR